MKQDVLRFDVLRFEGFRVQGLRSKVLTLPLKQVQQSSQGSAWRRVIAHAATLTILYPFFPESNNIRSHNKT